MRRRVLTRATLIAGITFAAAMWIIATVPWGVAVYHLVVFMAPGALLGLGTGWMAYASATDAWTWRVAWRCAVAGALVLPPVLALLVAIDGNARPHRLLTGFVRAAWLAFALGMAIATARAVHARSQKR